MTILNVLKALRDRGWLFSREHPHLPRARYTAEKLEGRAERAKRMGIPPELVHGEMVLASNAEMRRWCRAKSIAVYREDWIPTYPDAGDQVPDDAVYLQLFPKGQTCTMPFPWGVATRTKEVSNA